MASQPRPGKRNRGAPRRIKSSAALAAAAAIAAGTQAYGFPVRFNNPPQGSAHFRWAVLGIGGGAWLDVTRPAGSQPGVEYSVTSIFQYHYNGFLYSYGVLNGGPFFDFTVQSYPPVTPFGDFVVGQAAGTPIPAGSGQFGEFAYVFYNSSAYNYPGPIGSGPIYLGLRFDPGGGYFRYGWIGVTRNNLGLDAFAWGYESERGVPILAGAPGVTICPSAGCENADVSGNDCKIDLSDLAVLLSNFGQSGPSVPGDLNGDGIVSLSDLAAMLSKFGKTCY